MKYLLIGIAALGVVFGACSDDDDDVDEDAVRFADGRLRRREAGAVRGIEPDAGDRAATKAAPPIESDGNAPGIPSAHGHDRDDGERVEVHRPEGRRRRIAEGRRDQVTVHYTGWLTDGTKFDSSVDRGQPATFPLNGVIAGLDRRAADDEGRRQAAV